DPDTIYVSAVNGFGAFVGIPVATTGGGLITIYADGSFFYETPQNFTGEDTATFAVSDANNNTATATLRFYVANVSPSGPAYATLMNQALTVSADPQGLLHYAYSGIGNATSVTKVNGLAANVGVAVPTAQGGTITIQSNGSFVYAPPSDVACEDS